MGPWWREGDRMNHMSRSAKPELEQDVGLLPRDLRRGWCAGAHQARPDAIMARHRTVVRWDMPSTAAPGARPASPFPVAGPDPGSKGLLLTIASTGVLPS